MIINIVNNELITFAFEQLIEDSGTPIAGGENCQRDVRAGHKP